MTMKERKIRLTTVDKAKVFVSEAMKCNFDIDVYYNHVIIDAKSILGVLSLDLTKELSVRMYGENKEFEAFLDTLCKAGKRIA